MLSTLLPAQRLGTPLANQTALLHGGDYNPDQWLPEHPGILEQDARLMQAAGINSSSVGIFSWTALEPSPGKFTFDWLDRTLDSQAKIGNRVVLATPSGAMPAWLAEAYPEVRRVNREGFRFHYGGRHNHCWSSPIYHDLVARINTQLATRYKSHPALAMWHISNELNGECFCDLCRKRWAQWIEARYGTLDKANNAFWTGFWSHQATAWHHFEPTDYVVDGQMVDWLRFSNDQLIRWYRHEASTLRPITPNVPITTNFMTTSFTLNYQLISREVDVVCDDQYPAYDPESPEFLRTAIHFSFKDDLYRCFKSAEREAEARKTWFLMESCPGTIQWRTPMKLKRPGVHRLEMLQALAHGADGTSYFQFRAGRGAHEKLHGAVVEHAGTELAPSTRRFKDVAALSEAYKRLAPLLGTSVKPQVAILYDWESRWGQHHSVGTGVSHSHYDEIAEEQYKPFWNAGIPVDVISPDRAFEGYKLLIVPQHWFMTPLLGKKLTDFVHAGGTLVATFDTAMADESNRMLNGKVPGCGLDALFGVWVEETDRLPAGTEHPLTATGPASTLGLPATLTGRDIAAIAHLTGATALATFASDFYAGSPAVTVHQAGKGKAYFLATRLDEAATSAFYLGLMRQLSLLAPLPYPLPPGVTAQLRGAGGDAFLFLLNFSTTPQTVPLGDATLTDAETGQSHRGNLTLAPLAARVLRIKV